MPTNRPDYGTPSWAVEIVKAIKESLKRQIGEHRVIEYVGDGSYSMVVRVHNGLQDYAVKLLIDREARNQRFVNALRYAQDRDRRIKEWKESSHNLLFKEVDKMILLSECQFVVPYVSAGMGEIADEQLFPAPMFYLVMKFIKDGSLENFILHHRPVPIQCLEIAIQLLRAIKYATTQIQRDGEHIEIIHRDSDLDNIAVKEVSLIKELPSFLHIAVLDYGLARIQNVITSNLSRSALPMVRSTLPWETWFPNENSYRFGVFTDTYSVGMILLQLLFDAQVRDSRTSGMPDPMEQVVQLRNDGKFNLNVPDSERKNNFKNFLNLYLPHIRLIADESQNTPTPPTQQLRRVLERALAFGSRDREGNLILAPNERYHTAKEMLRALNTIRIDLFYQQAQQWIQNAPDRYEAEKRRLQRAMRWDSPEDAWAWNLLGEKLLLLNDEAAAHECCSEAIRIADFPEAYGNRALIRRFIADDSWHHEAKAKLYHQLADEDERRAKELLKK
jgi:serine/threonine protein kinase